MNVGCRRREVQWCPFRRELNVSRAQRSNQQAGTLNRRFSRLSKTSCSHITCVSTSRYQPRRTPRHIALPLSPVEVLTTTPAAVEKAVECGEAWAGGWIAAAPVPSSDMSWISLPNFTLLVVVLASLFTAFPPSTHNLQRAVSTFLTTHFPSLRPHLIPLSHSFHCVQHIPGQLISAPLSLPPAGSRVLVTGAAGFIGSHVATYLSSTLQLHVIAVDDLSGGFTSNLPPHSPHLTFLRGDVQNVTFVDELFHTHGPFYAVYHLAAYAAEGMSHFIRHFNYRNNLLASIALLNAAIRHGTHTFVFTSSIAVYGALEPPFTEDDTPHPEDPYGIAKYAFELDLRAAHTMFGIRFVIFRPHNVYGPHQNVIDRYRNVIGIFISHIMRGLPLPVFGDGLQTRAFTFVDDVAPAIAVAPYVREAENQVFNVGVDQSTTLLRLAAVISAAMNVTLRVTHLDSRHEVVHAASAHDKARCVFGLGDGLALEEGVRRTVEWVRAKGGEKGFVPVEFDEVEVMDRMPASWVTQAMKDSDDNKRKTWKSAAVERHEKAET